MREGETQIVIVLHLEMPDGTPVHFEIGGSGIKGSVLKECGTEEAANKGGECGGKIWHILEEMGFSRERKGALYLQEGIRFMALTEDDGMSMSKDVYPYLAQKFHTSADNVERSIRVAIERVWTQQEVGKLQEVYGESWGGKTGRPANSKFMKTIMRKVTA